jgi:hypothetical protein
MESYLNNLRHSKWQTSRKICICIWCVEETNFGFYETEESTGWVFIGDDPSRLFKMPQVSKEDGTNE